MLIDKIQAVLASLLCSLQVSHFWDCEWNPGPFKGKFWAILSVCGSNPILSVCGSNPPKPIN